MPLDIPELRVYGSTPVAQTVAREPLRTFINPFGKGWTGDLLEVAAQSGVVPSARTIVTSFYPLPAVPVAGVIRHENLRVTPPYIFDQDQNLTWLPAQRYVIWEGAAEAVTQ